MHRSRVAMGAFWLALLCTLGVSLLACSDVGDNLAPGASEYTTPPVSATDATTGSTSPGDARAGAGRAATVETGAMMADGGGFADGRASVDAGASENGSFESGTTGAADAGSMQTGADTGSMTPGDGAYSEAWRDTGGSLTTTETGAAPTPTPDTGAPNGGASDSGAPDTGATDAGAPEAGAPSRVPPTGAPDTGAQDTSAPDTGTVDSTVSDSAPDRVGVDSMAMDTATPADPCGPNGSTLDCLKTRDRASADPSVACSTCAQINGCLDPAMTGGNCELATATPMLLTGPLPDGQTCASVAGSASPTEKAICFALMRTVFASQCGAADQLGPCLCGTTDTQKCNSGMATPTGAAFDLYACDYDTINGATILAEFAVGTRGASETNALFVCAGAFNCDCFY